MSLAILISPSSFVELELAAAISTTISKYKVELPPDVLYPPVSFAKLFTLYSESLLIMMLAMLYRV